MRREFAGLGWQFQACCSGVQQFTLWRRWGRRVRAPANQRQENCYYHCFHVFLQNIQLFAFTIPGNTTIMALPLTVRVSRHTAFASGGRTTSAVIPLGIDACNW